ncbi:MAG: hypothetical protein WAM87_07330 [Terriglobales bacterium]
MNLLDGLNYYKQCSDSDWHFTVRVESSAVEVLKMISQHGDQPNASVLDAAHALLMGIEKWKAMCLKERMGNAEQNSPQAVWNAFRGTVDARNDLDAILSIMQLKGFGSSRDEESGQRRAKVATAALRFLKPETWGVVDWRTAAMLGLLVESNGNVDQALTLSKKHHAKDLKKTYELIDENGACAYNQMYRDRRAVPSFARTVDVEMAVFGLSMMAWPFPDSTGA